MGMRGREETNTKTFEALEQKSKNLKNFRMASCAEQSAMLKSDCVQVNWIRWKCKGIRGNVTQ
jgi:hypothetical protein